MMAYCWYFTQEDIENKTPSRDDGISSSVEARYRKDGSRFIINASNTLGLRHDTLATGVVYFHRFFMMQSFKQFDRWVVAAACLLLAGKVEETPKKCKDILKVTNSLLNEQQMRGFGSNHKEELLTHERILLQTIKFDLQLEHPYAFLLKYAKALKGEKSKIEKLVQMAWTFVNDSFSTTLCLQWEPQAIAVAFLYLAGKLTKVDLQSMVQSRSRSWWRQFVDTLDIHDLETICHQVLDLYGETGSKKQEDEKEVVSQPISEHPPATVAPPMTVKSAPLIQQQVPSQQNQSILGQPPSLPTNHITSVMSAQPTTGTQGFQTQASFFNPMGLSFMANPLQALQNLRPSTNQQSSAYSNQSYSTLGVSGGNTGLTSSQQVTAFSQLTGNNTTSPAIVNTGKLFLPSTPVGQRGIQPQQLVAVQKLTPQQLPPLQAGGQQVTPQQPHAAQHVMTPQQLSLQQMAPQQMSAQNLPPQQVNTQNVTLQQLGGVSQLTPQQLNGQRLIPQQMSTQQLTPQQANIRQLTPQQLSAQQLTPQQLSAQQLLTPQQLSTQPQSLLASNTVGTHQLPRAATISPGIRNVSSGIPIQQPASPYTMLPNSQKRLATTAPHNIMMQSSLSNNPQIGALVQASSAIPNQVLPNMTQQHVPVTMPTGVASGTLNSMNIGMNRVPQQLTPPTRPPGPPGQPMGQYNISGVGRGWGIR